MTQNNQSFWDRLIKKLTKSTPVERENEVKLDHNFDGIEELNNPLPPWWSAGFTITVIIAAVYIVFYFLYFYDPANNIKWQENELQREIAIANKKLAEYKKTHHIVDENSVTVLKDEKALAEGKQIYMKNCAVCHRADGGGQVGPNLTDDKWIYGCDIKSVFHTISQGTSKGMPPWKNLGNDKIQKVASYVLVKLHGTNPPNPKAPEGEACQ